MEQVHSNSPGLSGVFGTAAGSQASRARPSEWWSCVPVLRLPCRYRLGWCGWFPRARLNLGLRENCWFDTYFRDRIPCR